MQIQNYEEVVALIAKKDLFMYSNPKQPQVLTKDKKYEVIEVKLTTNHFIINDDQNQKHYFTFSKFEDYFIPVFKNDSIDTDWRQDYNKHKG